MTLAELVNKLHRPILNRCVPSSQMLVEFVQMLKLEEQEWLKVPENDFKSQQLAGYLTSKAKERGWIRRCVQQGLLSKSWNNWPRHNAIYTQAELDARYEGTSVRTISAGAFEQNRRKH